MRIVVVSTFEVYGGAAKAAKRLFNGIKSQPNTDVIFLTLFKRTDEKGVYGVREGIFAKAIIWFKFILERLYFFRFEKDKSMRYQFSPSVSGFDLSKHPLIKSADVVHLHWVNFGLLSIDGIQKLIQTKKKIVWTFHDMWAFTGGCHYAGDCIGFTKTCGNCAYLRSPSETDLSNQILKRKSNIDFSSIEMITCSSWLRNEALKSSLLQGKNISVIPNAIDIDSFKPLEKQILRESENLSNKRKYILFGAFSLDDERKGFHLLKESLKHLSNKSEVALICFGKSEQSLLDNLDVEVYNVGQVDSTDRIVELYNMSDVFVLPSLFDNLPNTVMESLSCGVPVVAYNVGGVGDMIDHLQNGYLAQSFDTIDFAKGIEYVLSCDEYSILQKNARQKVLENFSENVVLDQHMDIYRSNN